jgi:integrase
MTSEPIDLRGDGRIILYKRGKQGTYQARVKVPNSTGFVVKTTKTSKLHEATAFATNLYDELYYKVKGGGSIKSGPSYRAVYDEWIKYEKRTKITDTVARYSVPFFDKEPFEKVTEARLTDFWLHRQSSGIKRKPSNNYLVREITYLGTMWRYAKAKGYVQHIPNLNPLDITGKLIRRDAFTAKEWQTIFDSIPAWVEEDGKATKRDRVIAANHFIVLANTGIRVGEARGLKWTDIRTFGRHTIFEVTGKTGTREAVCLKGTDAALDRIRRYTGNQELVFCHPDGEPIGSFKTAFAALLKHAKEPVRGRSQYSLRHMFITGRLQNGVNPYHLAKQCGTSVEMLEKVYGHVIHSEIAEQITKTQLIEGLGADLTQFLEDDAK